MADKKISELDAIAGSATASDDLFLIVDSSGSVTKKISREELNNAIEQDVLSTVDINGGTIDSTVIGGTTPAAGDFTTLGATGNITVGGTVDGRDVATDGTKLDGIAASATANPNAIDNVVDDVTPQLGGNLDLNNFNITGTGDIPAANLTGALPAIDGSALTGIATDLVDDVTPQLGGNLDLNNFNITGTGDIPAANLTGALPAIDGSALTGIASDVVNDTTPQLGGDLLTNGNDITFGDNDKAIFGAGSDLQIFHDAGGSSHIRESGSDNLFIEATNLRLKSSNDTGENYLTANLDGAVTLYYDNSTKLATTATGINVTGTVAATAFSGDGSALTGVASDVVDDTTPQLGGDLSTNGNDINFADNDKAIFGAGSDLQIYHDGTHSRVDDAGTGKLILRGNDAVEIHKYTGEYMITAVADGAVTLYHDDSSKLATTATGVSVTGKITATAEGGSATVDLRQGSAKAWMRYKSNSSTVTRDSLNVSSTSDLGSGRTQFSFSNNMNNTYYAVSGIGNFQTSGGYPNRAGIGTASSAETAYTPTSSVRIDFATGNGGSNGSFLDTRTSAGTVHGDLA